MSFIQRLVSPRLPTVLAAHTHVDLPGYDLWLHNIDNIHVLPKELDVPVFEQALSKVLQLYPHAAGQLRCSDGVWSIEITNTAVPVDIDFQHDTSSDSFLDVDWVVQDDISTLLNRQPVGANLVNGTAPLLRLKLTFLNNETCIGVSWHHTLGDAIALSRFMHTFSQFYQGISPDHEPPAFKKFLFPPPSCSITKKYWPRIAHLHDSHSFNEVGEKYAELYKNIEHLRWRFDRDELNKLRSIISSRGPTESHLSKQDCLTAYLVAILNHNRDTQVQNVTNISNCRNICTSFISENVAGNLVQNVPAVVPTDMAGIAAAIRHALIECRETDYLYDWLTVASSRMLETVNAGRSFLFGCDDSTVTVNSNTVIDWCSAHFGCPDGSRFYTAGVVKHFLRCFRSNPTKGDDGVWHTSQSVEVAIGVSDEMKPKALETLALGIQHLLDNEHTRM